MKLFPALKTVLVFAFGIILADWNEIGFIPLVIFTVFTLIISVVFHTKSFGRWLLILALIGSGALAFRASIPPDDFPPVILTLTGHISQPPIRYDRMMTFPVDIERIGQTNGIYAEQPGKVWVRLKDVDDRIFQGVKVILHGEFRPLTLMRNPGDFNLKSWRERNGYVGEMYVTAGKCTVTNEPIPYIYRLRNWISTTVEYHNKSNAPLLRALLLGIRRDLDPVMTENLRRAGLSHLLALSGLHVGFLVGIWLGIGGILRLKPSGRATLILLILVHRPAQ
ncbi:MAG: ComEC/Rec2 family competence protein [Candidatus Electryoneaceae bacterium]|nr:ComEC/Rec2 family competence protein [Candidatus Electryoneaceae bacterium]